MVQRLYWGTKKHKLIDAIGCVFFIFVLPVLYFCVVFNVFCLLALCARVLTGLALQTPKSNFPMGTITYLSIYEHFSMVFLLHLKHKKGHTSSAIKTVDYMM